MDVALLKPDTGGSGKERGKRWALASGPSPAWAAPSGLARQAHYLIPFLCLDHACFRFLGKW
ncbi:hypothetical protein RchiOBHm_Chr5g0041381 [Rosa chinensis]|uniref:Uncharacterized protein n=1 Tax=Rosa chinensis TaxID=74649 RepID=A0A2P6QCU0_ROSCH|nr:hypothetical protein RchiOBHm_Chr5g0041381 [Rosa chinensis]